MYLSPFFAHFYLLMFYMCTLWIICHDLNTCDAFSSPDWFQIPVTLSVIWVLKSVIGIQKSLGERLHDMTGLSLGPEGNMDSYRDY